MRKMKNLLVGLLLGASLCLFSIFGVVGGWAEVRDDSIQWGSSYEEWMKDFKEWAAEDIRVKRGVRNWGFSVGSENMVTARNLLLDGYRSALVEGFERPLAPEVLMWIDVLVGDFWMVMWLNAWSDDLRTRLDIDAEVKLRASYKRGELAPLRKLNSETLSELRETINLLLSIQEMLADAHKRFMDDWNVFQGLKKEYKYVPERAGLFLKEQGLIEVSDAEIASIIKERVSSCSTLEEAWEVIDEVLEKYGVFQISGPGVKEIRDMLDEMRDGHEAEGKSKK